MPGSPWCQRSHPKPHSHTHPHLHPHCSLPCLMCRLAADVEANPEHYRIRLGDWFDMLAGTSTGGLLAIYRESRRGCQ